MASGKPGSGSGKEQARLGEIDRRLLREPGNVDLRYERARLLDRLGRLADATTQYADVLSRSPKHFGAINDLALMLYKAGRRQDAFGLYLEAVERHPDNAVAHANLGFMFLKANEPARARASYEAALRLDPRSAEVQRGLASARAQLGEGPTTAATASGTVAPEAAAGPSSASASDGAPPPASLSGGSIVTLPYRGTGRGIAVLVPVTLAAGNVAVERLLDDRVFATTKLVAELHGDAPLPPHDIVFNAIGDADSAAAALDAADALLAATTAPVLNHPARVRMTSRVANAARLRDLPGVIAPKAESLPRSLLSSSGALEMLAARGFSFPLLLRSPGYHTGFNFERVERAEDVAVVASRLPGDELLVIEYVDTRASDGTFRKYRVMFVGGELYPLHMAISHHWKVHYFSADMADRADHRALDAAFLTDMHDALGAPAVAALERIRDTLALDYAGIDFALNERGEIVVFEANATMVIALPADDERWTYRRAPVERVVAAFRAMLRARAEEGLASR
jgi:glutathione synthase/RimK-type ligase-like ATP-grasp enzyme